MGAGLGSTGDGRFLPEVGCARDREHATLAFDDRSGTVHGAGKTTPRKLLDSLERARWWSLPSGVSA